MRFSPRMICKTFLILHCDAHADLATPLLSQSADGWIDEITGRFVNLKIPSTVGDAVISTAVRIDSFIFPFLNEWRDSARFWHIVPRGISYPVLNPRATARQIKQAVDLANLRDEVSSATKLLLHIDLDYFNNRYDGNNASLKTPAQHDPSLEQITSNLEVLLNQLALSGRVPQIENVSIAISPGFTPAELWSPLLHLLLEGLQRIGCVVPF